MNFGGTVKINPLGICVILGLTFIFLLYSFARRPSYEKEVNLKDLLIAAINVAEKGGEEINVISQSELNKQSKGKTREGANEFVTDADKRSHCLMYYSLLSTFPSLKVISEETLSKDECSPYIEYLSLTTTDDKINSLSDLYVPVEDVTVWIDPLDATQEFTEQLTSYVTVMVCVAFKGNPIIGVIHQPFDQHFTSWAWDGIAISPDLRRPTKKSESQPNIIVSRSHAGEVKQSISKVLPQAKVIPAGGSGYKVLQLINGNASAYVHSTYIKKWDICAGNAILKSLKGRMSTLKNEDIDYSSKNEIKVKNGILAALNEHDKYYQIFKNII